MSTATLTREPYAISYDRLSRVRSGENMPEVTVGNVRQHEDNVAFAEVDLGGVRERFSDKGSASRFRAKERDDWPALLAEIRSGRPTHVVLWVLDRIIRDDEDRVALIKACRESGTLIVQSGSGTVIDPNDPDSVFLATILGAVAVLEIEKMSKRIRRFKQARRDAGLPHGGKRWFGYLDASDDGTRKRNMKADPVESEIYRELVGRFLGGEALHSLANWLTLNGVPTVSGGVWTAPSVRAILLNPRYAGRLIHNGDDVGAGVWDALIDEATNESVRRRLDNPSRRTNNGQNARVYLLAGLGVCATCGEHLRGRPLHSSTSTREGGEYGARAYACRTGRHVHRSVEYVDAVVEALVIERLSRRDLNTALLDNDAADEARALTVDRDAARARLDALADQYADGVLSASAYGKATARIEANVADLDARIGQASERAKAPVAILDGMTGEGAREAWANADLGRRRALVGLLFARVALRGGRGPFRPESVEVDWR